MSTYEERQLGSSSASILYADGRIYGIDEQGKTAVVKPVKAFQLLATNEFQERTLASMSVCDRGVITWYGSSHEWGLSLKPNRARPRACEQLFYRTR